MLGRGVGLIVSPGGIVGIFALRWWLDVAVVARVVVGELCVALMLRRLGRPGLVTRLAVRSRGRFANHC